MAQWNFGDILDTIIPLVPEGHKALIHGTRAITWQELDRRSNNLAREMLKHGGIVGDKVAFYMRNRPEYMEALAACFRARLTHVNVNYRYVADEVHYIFDNSDATIVVYGAEFRHNIDVLRERLPKVKLWIEIDGISKENNGIIPYEALANSGNGTNLNIERAHDDMLFLYTGGTTGMPKGVMWTHTALREASLIALRALGPIPETLDELAASIRENNESGGDGEIIIPACPLMHGTGLFTALSAFLGGGTVVTLESSSLNTQELWTAVEKHRVQNIAIVGDAFAKPMLETLENNPGQYDTSSLISMISSGVMWSQEVKQNLIKHIPQVILADSFGASEAVGFGSSITVKDAPTQTAKFTTNDLCKVFDENDQEISRGSDTPGFIAFGGPIPEGYYKDPEKTAKVFKTIGGTRFSIPGDYCLVAEDGTLTLLGRGSVCINSAGEKIYPEEIEEVLKTHDGVDDALVIGVPDPKWGQAVTAIVQANGEIAVEALQAYVRSRLAAYKTPKNILFNPPPLRASNGKADYKTATEFAHKSLGL